MSIKIAGPKAPEKYYNMTLYKVADVFPTSSKGILTARFTNNRFGYVTEELLPITSERFLYVEENLTGGTGIVICENNLYNMLRTDGTLVFEEGYNKIERIGANIIRITKKTDVGKLIYNLARIEDGKVLLDKWFETSN